jgi:hypothetical protein
VKRILKFYYLRAGRFCKCDSNCQAVVAVNTVMSAQHGGGQAHPRSDGLQQARGEKQQCGAGSNILAQSRFRILAQSRSCILAQSASGSKIKQIFFSQFFIKSSQKIPYYPIHNSFYNYAGVYIIVRKRFLFPPPFSNFIFFPHSQHRARSKIRLLVP